MDSWPSGIAAITLFVEDLAEAKRFYREVFGLPVTFEDASSAVFTFGDTMVAAQQAGSRLQLTIEVEDVDAMCAELTSRGVQLLNGPMDRPWGIRTASFRDPGGHIWEIAH